MSHEQEMIYFQLMMTTYGIWNWALIVLIDGVEDVKFYSLSLHNAEVPMGPNQPGPTVYKKI